ncbi:hypothetical protein SDC9_103101 [bioreactor metagenome]|uniref:Uncharacterized protein n=1 Tax=bioreactor metagenome TaxID=1076179 RepID=A0A645AT97_9ZZZZ
MSTGHRSSTPTTPTRAAPGRWTRIIPTLASTPARCLTFHAIATRPSSTRCLPKTGWRCRRSGPSWRACDSITPTSHVRTWWRAGRRFNAATPTRAGVSARSTSSILIFRCTPSTPRRLILLADYLCCRPQIPHLMLRRVSSWKLASSNRSGRGRATGLWRRIPSPRTIC